MIEFEKKKTIEPTPKVENTRVDKIRESAPEERKKSAADSTRRHALLTKEGD